MKLLSKQSPLFWAILLATGITLTGISAKPGPDHHTTPEQRKKQQEAEKRAADARQAQLQRTDALIAAIKARQLPQVKALAASVGDMNAPNAKGEPPLYHAALVADRAIVKALMDNKATLMNTYDHSAMNVAIDKKNVDLVNLLLGAGGNLQGHLEYAATKGNARIIEILVSRGADANLARSGPQGTHYSNYSPLMLAIDAGNLDTATALIGKGAKINQAIAVGKSTVTVLQLAAKNQNAAFVKLLIAKGVNVKESHGQTVSCLVASVDSGNIEIARALLAAGADARASIAYGRSGQRMTPIKAAQQKNRQDFVDLFKAAGATE